MEEQKVVNEQEFSFRKYAWRQFKKNKPALISMYILGILLFIFIFADLIANNQPIYAKYQGTDYYPAITSIFNPTKVDTVVNKATGKQEIIQFDIAKWKQMKLDEVVWAPIPYSPNEPDPYNRNYVSPFGKQVYKNSGGEIVSAPNRFRHHLGTTKIGKDVASGLIHGTRISLTVGLVAMAIAGLLGIVLGALAGYFGDNRLTTPRGKFYVILIGLIMGIFYGFIVRSNAISQGFESGILPTLWQLLLSIAILIAIIKLFEIIGRPVSKIPFLSNQVTVPVDGMVLRTIEILRSIPGLILLITIASLFQEKSLFLMMAIIGLISWTGIARFTRAEFLRTRSLDYIEAAKALGYSERRTIFKHALPNSIAPVFVAIAFGIAIAILTESMLSFLGIGVPADVVTWGSLLNLGQERFSAWWLVIFPGLAIFITVTIFNLIGDALRDATDPKLKD